MNSEFENRLNVAEAKLDMLNLELYGVMLVISKIIVRLDDEQAMGLRNDLSDMTTHMAALGNFPDELDAIDVIIDLVDGRIASVAKHQCD